jgi:hypothetical protein
MVLFGSLRARRFVLRGTILALSLLIASLAARNAQAAFTVCRSDPLVTLSNGVQVTLYEDISDTATDVTGITYQLHIPAGLKVKSISYNGAIPSSLQTITTTADENSGNYDAYTVVDTKTSNVSVTAYMSANAAVSCQTTGHSGQLLHSHLHLS